jgi:transcriptional regulator with XRE-family HTH domain
VNELLDQLRGDFQDEDSRYAYADSVANAFVAAQIKALREERKLTQEQLAELTGTKQSGISRFQRADYSGSKIETLRKFARAFGVRLRVSFEEFGSLLPDIGGFTKERLTPRKFEDDPVFNPKKQQESERFAAATAQEGLDRSRRAHKEGRACTVPTVTDFALRIKPGDWNTLKPVGTVSPCPADANPSSEPGAADKPTPQSLLPKPVLGAIHPRESTTEINSGAMPNAGDSTSTVVPINKKLRGETRTWTNKKRLSPQNRLLGRLENF